MLPLFDFTISMRKHILSFIFLLFFAQLSWAVDASYYSVIEGLQDSILKSTLGAFTFANYTNRYSYGSGSGKTWEAFYYTDRNTSDNSAIDRYSDTLRYFDSNNPTASISGLHIEHMFPNSWFGGKSGNNHAYSDLHHLTPADETANMSKSNNGPGVPTDTTFYNGVWVNGKTADNRSVFCPPDEYKGDFARAFFYIATTYGDTATWVTDIAQNYMSNTDWMEFLPAMRELLLYWHRIDPVSEMERTRMETVAQLQGNRNPFIDYPCLAEYIWGYKKGTPVSLATLATACDETYTATWMVGGVSYAQTTNMYGLSPAMPAAPDHCSELREFVGWTAQSNVTSRPSDLFIEEAPSMTQDITYNAVFADKEQSSQLAGQVTYAFTSKSWAATPANWTSSKDGYSYKNDGVQISQGTTGANATCPASYNHITQIIVTYCTNATAGAGNVIITVGDSTQTQSVSKAKGTTPRNLVFAFSGTYPSGAPHIQVDCTTSSIYIIRVTICYGEPYHDYSLYCGEPPVANTYTVNWHVDGTTTPIEYTEGDPLVLPSTPADCSETRLFKGWTTNSSYEGDGSDLITPSGNVTAAADYYAVYADKITTQGTSTTYENFSTTCTTVCTATITVTPEDPTQGSVTIE